MTDINSVHDSDFVYDYPDGFDHWLLLHTNTAASFRFNEVDYETECNTMVLYPPGEPVYYHATEDIYSDDRLFFSADKNDLCISSFPICMPINDPLPVMVRALFQFLCVENISCVSDIIAARIRYARYKLVCSDMPLAGISLECGYKNIEHFFRQFKKQTGYSPKEYRKQAQD